MTRFIQPATCSIASNYPTVHEAFLNRLRSVIARIGDWPDSAQEVAERPGVRTVPLIRYLYKVFIGTADKKSKYFTFITPRETSKA